MSFWNTKELTQMTPSEWELLCDGCGKCCLNKLIDDETDELYYTNAACKLLDRESCRCIHYDNRFTFVPLCTEISPENIASLTWLPDSCAYKRLFNKKPLPSWHPLITGSADAMHLAGMSVRGKAVCETSIIEVEDHIVLWPLKEID